MAAKWIEALTGSLEQKKQYKQDKARIDALPEPYATAATGAAPLLHVLRRHHRRRHPRHDVRRPRRPLGARRRSTAPPCARSSATTRWSSPRPSRRPTPARQWIDKERARLTKAIDGRRRQRDRRPEPHDHRPGPRARDPGAGHREVLQGRARAARRRLRRARRAASSPCSARTAPARPRSCASCRRC